MTRSLGDLVGKTVGVTYEPEIKTISSSISDAIVIASDGIWDRVGNEEVCKVVRERHQNGKDASGAG